MGMAETRQQNYSKKELLQRLIQALGKFGAEATVDQQRQAIIQCYKDLDEQIFHKQRIENESSLPRTSSGISGSTAVVYLAVKYPNEARREMLINLGDSRAIVVRNGEVKKATIDHNLDNPIEWDRIKRNGEEQTHSGCTVHGENRGVS